MGAPLQGGSSGNASGSHQRVFRDSHEIQSPEQAHAARVRLREVERRFMLTVDATGLAVLAREISTLRASLSAYRLRLEIRSSRESKTTLGGEHGITPSDTPGNRWRI